MQYSGRLAAGTTPVSACSYPVIKTGICMLFVRSILLLPPCVLLLYNGP